LQYNLKDIPKGYKKEVVVVEMSYSYTLDENDVWDNIIDLAEKPTTNKPVTPEGQMAMLHDVMAIVRAVSHDRRLGLINWDETWIGEIENGRDPVDPASGNGWESQALFDYDVRTLPALKEFIP
jgi:arabinogalactan endo-1,4-beta-galactosidase